MRLSKANKLLMEEFLEAAGEDKVELQDKKKKPKAPRTKNANQKGPGNEPFKAKAITTSKASRGFTTKKPPKAHLSYPL